IVSKLGIVFFNSLSKMRPHDPDERLSCPRTASLSPDPGQFLQSGSEGDSPRARKPSFAFLTLYSISIFMSLRPISCKLFSKSLLISRRFLILTGPDPTNESLTIM
ncbi:MAG TPA: hypothetical protein VMT22_08355, partial [Terriglobales bacterium]|nr:hypothetical protein [Terriglobales bacterium]